MYQVEVIGDPGAEPVSLAEAKAQLRVDHSDEDALIGRLISAARQRVENLTGQVLRASTLRITFSGFSNPMRIPRAPISDVVSIEYGADAVTDWRFMTEAGAPTLRPALDASWPVTREAAVIEVEAGYAQGEAPEQLRHAILLAVAAWYDDRLEGDLPSGSVALACDYKLTWI